MSHSNQFWLFSKSLKYLTYFAGILKCIEIHPTPRLMSNLNIFLESVLGVFMIVGVGMQSKSHNVPYRLG